MAICMISVWVIAEFYVGYCFSNDTVYQAEYDTGYLYEIFCFEKKFFFCVFLGSSMENYCGVFFF